MNIITLPKDTLYLQKSIISNVVIVANVGAGIVHTVLTKIRKLLKKRLLRNVFELKDKKSTIDKKKIIFAKLYSVKIKYCCLIMLFKQG